jgi:hypothetical protein
MRSNHPFEAMIALIKRTPVPFSAAAPHKNEIPLGTLGLVKAFLFC